MAMAEKEAIVFVLDANLTMNAPYPSPAGLATGASPQSTRLSQAKDAVLGASKF